MTKRRAADIAPVQPSPLGGNWVLYVCIQGPDYLIEREQRFLREADAQKWLRWFLRHKDIAPYAQGSRVQMYSELLYCRPDELMTYADMRYWTRENTDLKRFFLHPKDFSMKKTPSLFVRQFHGDRRYQPFYSPGTEWVSAGEGIATRKYNGTCCLVDGDRLYRRYNAKHGKTPPADFQPAQPEADPTTGHWPGWIPVRLDDPLAKWHVEAWKRQHGEWGGLRSGTYELIGPKVQGGAEVDLHQGQHTLIRHGAHPLPDAPRTFDELHHYLLAHPTWEGVVWHHPDGRLVKATLSGFRGQVKR